ncbi:MAG: acyltransferase [Bacteroidetes bacterium]|nr:acyltransferase [Bacteroidota bacterium]
MEKPIYLKGLNGIRAIAAIIVMIGHIEIHKRSENFFKLVNLDYTGLFARYAVDIFFVLSGFLITFLLINEKEKTGTIHIKNFLIRRALRIWPLYYLVFLGVLLGANFIPLLDISQFTTKGINTWQSTILYLLLLPQVAFALNLSFYCVDILWSIGVEEQFYLFWPFFMKYSKRILFVSLTIIAVFPILRLLSDFNLTGKYFRLFDESTSGFISIFLYQSKFDLMAIGAVTAFILTSKSRWSLLFLEKIKLPIVPYLALAMIILLWMHYGLLPVFMQMDVQAVFYAIIILFVCVTPKPIRLLENRVMNLLGKLSFGIYVFHEIGIVIVSNTCNYLEIHSFRSLPASIAYTLSVATLTIGMAALSYFFYERRFLQKKKQFMVVRSTNDSADRD